MKKRIFLLCAAVLFVGTSLAQIGYKGQVVLSAEGGINQSGGVNAAFRIEGYASAYSVLGAGVSYDRTEYRTVEDDAFLAAQWLGVVQYRYARPLGRFIVSPGVGFVLGGEHCDVVSRLGNPLPYRGRFVYGFCVDVGAEYVWGRHWAVFLCPRVQYLMKTQFRNFEFFTNLGVKFYF